MVEEPAVFVFYQAGDVFRRIVVGGGKTPLSVVGNLSAEQFAVSRRQDGGIWLVELWNGDAKKTKKKARKNQQGNF